MSRTMPCNGLLSALGVTGGSDSRSRQSESSGRVAAAPRQLWHATSMTPRTVRSVPRRPCCVCETSPTDSRHPVHDRSAGPRRGCRTWTGQTDHPTWLPCKNRSVPRVHARWRRRPLEQCKRGSGLSARVEGKRLNAAPGGYVVHWKRFAVLSPERHRLTAMPAESTATPWARHRIPWRVPAKAALQRDC